jgi:hypothetical protein
MSVKQLHESAWTQHDASVLVVQLITNMCDLISVPSQGINKVLLRLSVLRKPFTTQSFRRSSCFRRSNRVVSDIEWRGSGCLVSEYNHL